MSLFFELRDYIYSYIDGEYTALHDRAASMSYNANLFDLEKIDMWYVQECRRIEKFKKYLFYLLFSKQYFILEDILGVDVTVEYIENNKTIIKIKDNRFKYIKKKHNDYSFKYLDCDDGFDYANDDDYVPLNIVIKRKKSTWHISDIHQEGVYRPPIDTRRKTFYDDIYNIKRKLKDIFKFARVVGFSLSYKIYNGISYGDEIVVPQAGDQESFGGDVVATTTTHHNVVLTENQIVQDEQVLVRQRKWANAASSDVVADHDTLVNRYFPVNTFTWTTSQVAGTTLVALDLPRILLTQNDTSDYPNTIPFRVHSKWRGDILVKVLLNANKFQVGQLQLSWYYQPKYDASFNLRNNQYSRSGTHHVIINASPNNEVSLTIPFRTYKTLLSTRQRSDGPLALDLGTLFITVLNRLAVSNSTSNSCSGTVYIALENNQFTGMLAGNIGTIVAPQGLLDTLSPIVDTVLNPGHLLESLIPMAVPFIRQGAEGLLNQILPDPNRDNPPLVEPARMLVPMSSNSWSAGTGCEEPINNLRLDNRGQTAHPDLDIDEMQIQHIIRKYMLLSQFTWSFQQLRGTILYSTPANPCPPSSDMYVISQGGSNVLPVYQLTNIAYISCLYEQWRGPLEYRFDFVATPYHSGRVLLAYIPNIEENQVVTIDQARASPHVVVSLDDTLSYTWVVPYISDKIWWRRRYAGNSTINNNQSPSKIFMFVLNPLVYVDNVVQTIDVNVYIRAGEGFEFSVPVQPSIGMGYSRNYVIEYNEDSVTQIPAARAFYLGYAEGVDVVTAIDFPLTSIKQAIFTPPIISRRVYYDYTSREPSQEPTPTLVYNNTRNAYPYALVIRVAGVWRLFPIRYLPNVNAETRLVALLDGLLAVSYSFAAVQTFNAFADQFVADFSNEVTGYGFLGEGLTGGTGAGGQFSSYVSRDIISDFEIIEPQGNREESVITVDCSKSLISTGSGIMTFGESFHDLKDLTRRYQLYGTFVVVRDLITDVIGRCSVIIPLLPQGLQLEVNDEIVVNRIYNRAREGHIPLIVNMYRHYRGSLRYRIIVSNGDGLFVWIQHRPDRKLTSKQILYCFSVETAEAVFNHGYAFYIQDLNVNRVIQIEIPFYQSGNFGLTQDPDLAANDEVRQFYSLGELSIGFYGATPATNLQCQVFYSVGDDFRCSTFQGVPPTVLLNDIPAAVPQGITDWLSIRPLVEAHGSKVGENICDNLKQDSLKALEEVKQTFTEAADKFVNGVDVSVRATVASILSQLVHVIINPCVKTICISISSILVSMGIIAITSIDAITSTIRQLFESISPTKQHNGDDTEVTPQGEVGEKAATGFISVLIGGLCTIFSVDSKSVSGSSKSKWQADLFAGIDRGMRLSNTCFIFCRNLFLVLEDMKIYIVSLFNKQYKALTMFNNNKDLITKWITVSNDLTDAAYARTIRYSISKQQKFYDAYSLGKLLIAKCADIDDANIRGMITRTFNELKKLDVKLTSEGVSPHVRKMPFTVYLYGDRNIGKSFLTASTIGKLLESQGITTETEMSCILTPASSYWDNCDGQPALIIDDLFSVAEPTMLAAQLYAIFATVTPVILIPPKASLEDKGRPYAPEIFWMNSNVEYFTHSYVTNNEALWRRRDILIEAAVNDVPKEGCEHCKRGWKVNEVPSEHLDTLADFHHLKFRYKTIVDDPKIDYGDWISYDQMMTVLMSKFAENRRVAEHNFQTLLKENMRVTGAETIVDCHVNSLEKEWRQAIAQRRRLTENLEKSIFSQICSSFKNSPILDKLKFWRSDDCVPGNADCDTCTKDKMCAGCLFLKDNVVPIEDEDVEPCAATPSGTQTLFDMATPQADEEVTTLLYNVMQSYMFVGPTIIKYLKSVNKDYPNDIAVRFYKFLLESRSMNLIIKKINSYPKYTHSIKIFQHVCESICADCIHNADPLTYRNSALFIGDCKVIDCIKACDLDPPPCMYCILMLPWIIRKYARDGVRKYNIIEPWSMSFTTDLQRYHSKVNLNRFWDKFKMYYDAFIDNILVPSAKAVWKFISSGKFLTLMLTGLIGLSCWYGTRNRPVSHHEEINDDDAWYESKGYDGVKPKVVTRSPPTVVKPQAEVKQSQQFQYIVNNMHRILVYLVCVKGNMVKQFCCVGIRDRDILIQKHYWDIAQEADYLYIKYYDFVPTAQYQFGVPIELSQLVVKWFTVTSDIDSDLLDSNFGLLTLPTSVRPFKNIVNFIANKREHSICKLSTSAIYEHGSKNVYILPVIIKSDLLISQNNNLYKNPVRLKQCYQYNLSNPGYCGSVLLCPSSATPIIGIHVAGSNTWGYAEPLVYESFVSIKRNTQRFDFDTAPLYMEDEEFNKLNLPSTLYPHGIVPKQLAHSQSGITQYIPSLIHGLYPVTSEPNPLSAKDDRLPPGSDPLLDGIAWMGCPPLDFHADLLTPAKDNLTQVFIDNICPERQIELISLQDAICGRPNIQGFEPLSWNTSEGFPLKAIRPSKATGKKWLFDLKETEEGYVLQGLHSELQRLLKVEYNYRCRGIKVPTIFIDNLKDTCIPSEKCRIKGKTRIFSISPVQYTIAFKQYFGDFMALYQQARLQAEHGIGIDVNSWDWAELGVHLQERGTAIIAGDYKNFGPGLMLSCVTAGCEVILRWYEHYDKDAERNLIRRVLLSELIGSLHLCKDQVYSVSSGIPSGSPITTPLNSIVNSLYIRCAWQSITGLGCDKLLQSCNIVTFGDDVCINVSDEWKDKFNTETMHNFFKKYSIVFTDVDKSDNIVKYRTLSNVTFLKRGFVAHPRVPFAMLAPIEDDAIFKCLNWIKRTGDPALNTVEHCEQACELAYGKGSVYYNDLRSNLVSECRKLGIQLPRIPLWNEVTKRCFGK